MKRLAAILLLGIFSFNLFGYQLVATYLESRENQKIELALDKDDYTDAELLSIKQPTNLPYYQNSSTFQRIDGEIEIAGVYYRYVKCRIYNDSLELLCIPNTGKMRIQAAKADFSKMASGLQQPDNSKKSSSDSKAVKKATSEFEAIQLIAGLQAAPLSSTFIIRNHLFSAYLFSSSVEQPPDVIS